MLEAVHGAVRRLYKISNCTFQCYYYYFVIIMYKHVHAHGWSCRYIILIYNIFDSSGNEVYRKVKLDKGRTLPYDI